ncbi:MAG: c-type cytochrome domain-containing protein [Planctomycetota bacterium]
MMLPLCITFLLGADGVKPVSFFRGVRPILQSHCAGCHQPAKAGGKVVLTGYDEISAHRSLIVPGKPAESELVTVLLEDGDRPAKMPKNGAPLAANEIAVIQSWIAEGAVDDTPAAARTQFSMEQPPTYAQPPVVTSVDFSPDGSLLAVSGYHEVLLFDHHDGGAALAAHLVGLSERIQAVRFSPDGATLLAVGGSPARLGEVQLWRVAERKLHLSVPVGFDTLYGAAWSDDGKRIAFGSDHIVRALDADTGEQVLYQGAHEDLVLDTVFSHDGKYLVSVSRDRSMKLIEVATQQFIDNITSITPGALKGGLMAVARQPGSDLLLCGGADGTPRTYQMHRTKERKIGDDYNLVKAYAALDGRIFAIDWSPDGKRFAIGASLPGGRGEIRLYALDQDTPLWRLSTSGAIYALSFHPSGQVIAAGGFAGDVLLLSESGAILNHATMIGS